MKIIRLTAFFVLALSFLAFTTEAQRTRRKPTPKATPKPTPVRTTPTNAVVSAAKQRVANQLHNVNVFVDRTQDAEREGELEIWVATRAEQRGAGQANQMFVLYDGEHYKGVPGKGEWQVTQFAEGGYPIRLGEINGRAGKAGMTPPWPASDRR